MGKRQREREGKSVSGNERVRERNVNGRSRSFPDPPAYAFLLLLTLVLPRCLVPGDTDPEIQYVGRATVECAAVPVSRRSDRHIAAGPDVVAEAAEHTEAAIG